MYKRQGETEIVYERAPRTIRIIDIASISNPNGYYTGEETEYKETTGVPQTQPETQSVTSQPAEITETQNINTVENGQEKFKFDSKAVLAVGTVFIIIVLFTAVVIFVDVYKRQLLHRLARTLTGPHAVYFLSAQVPPRYGRPLKLLYTVCTPCL